MFKYMVWLERLDSTQTHLKKKNYPHGTVVVADFQSAGRGRLGRVWESQEGGLYFSFLMKDIHGKDISPLPLVLGYSLVKSLRYFGLNTSIKWPNDVYASGKKLCGILVERVKKGLVVGIGVNVNQREFPMEVEDKAVSIRLLKGVEVSRKVVLLKLLENIYGDILKFQTGGFGAFKSSVEELLLFKGQEVVVLSEKPVAGLLLGIDDYGRLMLRTPNGVREVISGEVSLRLR